MQVPRGTRKLEVWPGGGEDKRPFLWVHYQVLDSDEPAVRVVVRTGAHVSGTLVGPDGAPIVGAYVRAFPEAFGFSGVSTDPEGRFKLGVLENSVVDVCFDSEAEAEEPEEVSPKVVPDGHGSGAASTLRWTGVRRAIARRVPSGSTDVKLVARTVAVDADLDVIVRGPNGAPVVGARVRANCGLTNGQALVAQTTDSRGLAHFSRLPRWECSLDVTPPEPEPDGFSEVTLLSRRVEGALPGGGLVSVVLESTAALRGRVVDSRGRPAVGASCTGRRGLSYLGCARISEDGRFVMPSSAPLGAKFQLVVTFPGNTLGRPTSRAVVDAIVGGGDLSITLDDVPAPPAKR